MDKDSQVLQILRREGELFNKSRTDDVICEIVDVLEHGKDAGNQITSSDQTHYRYDCYLGRRPKAPAYPLFKVEEHISSIFSVIITPYGSKDEIKVDSLEDLSKEVKSILNSENTQKIIQSQV